MARFVGTARNDTITPATISAGVVIIPAGADLSGDDRILSRSGNDRVEGDSGDDVAFLGNGKDRFIWNPGDGDDSFNGGSGTDTLEFNGSDDAELMTVTTLDNGGFRFFRDLGDITVDTRRVERVEVNALGGNDTIDGSAQTRSNVELEIDGGAGRDSLTGGAGDDSLTGGAGRDSLMGDAGDDSLTGEQGRDTFIFQPGTEDDRVLDFTDNNGAQDDRIDLSAYGFTDVGEINRGISGNDVVLSLGGGDTVRLVDYLANHALNDLQNNDFIF
jgi:Ca2+-binding RTX toxin-like protein